MEQLSLFEPGDPSEPAQYLYIGARNGQLKIGLSRHPRRRATELKLVLLHVEPGTKSLEQSLHRRFRSSRIDREWFMPTGDVLAWLVHRQTQEQRAS